jgi:hypothetical protein
VDGHTNLIVDEDAIGEAPGELPTKVSVCLRRLSMPCDLTKQCDVLSMADRLEETGRSERTAHWQLAYGSPKRADPPVWPCCDFVSDRSRGRRIEILEPQSHFLGKNRQEGAILAGNSRDGAGQLLGISAD